MNKRVAKKIVKRGADEKSLSRLEKAAYVAYRHGAISGVTMLKMLCTIWNRQTVNKYNLYVVPNYGNIEPVDEMVAVIKPIAVGIGKSVSDAEQKWFSFKATCKFQ